LADTTYTYSGKEITAQVYAENIRVVNGSYHFDVAGTSFTIQQLVLSMGGLHNIENAVAAITVAHQLGISADAIRNALADFKGVKRRFEYKIREEGQVLIDDYAHHPEELRALITGVKSIFPDQRITLVFQPHLYSRTRDLCDAFAESLDLADEVILLPIYPARELPMEGVSSEMIFEKMQHAAVQILSKADCLQRIVRERPSLLVMAGAGDIDQLIIQATQLLQNNPHA
jgi:UDP-N-acetylmuramate--alanine ligase